MVNQQVLEGHWNEVKGKLRAHWAEHEARDQEEGEPLFDTPTGDASLPARASQDDPTEPAAGRGR